MDSSVVISFAFTNPINSKTEHHSIEEMADPFIHTGAKRRRVEGTQAPKTESAVTWKPPSIPDSRFADESVWANNSGVGFTSQFHLINSNMSLNQPETSSWSGNDQPIQGYHGNDARWERMNDQKETSSSAFTPGDESSVAMAGEGWNAVSNANKYFRPDRMSRNFGGRPGEAEPDLNRSRLHHGEHRAETCYGGRDTSYSSQVPSYGVNLMQSSELIIQSKAFQTQIVEGPQVKATTCLDSNSIFADSGLCETTQIPSGTDENELVCFGMVRAFIARQENLFAYVRNRRSWVFLENASFLLGIANKQAFQAILSDFIRLQNSVLPPMQNSAALSQKTSILSCYRHSSMSHRL